MKKPCDRSGMGAPVNMPQHVYDGWDGGGRNPVSTHHEVRPFGELGECASIPFREYMSCTRQTGDCKVLSRCVTSPCIMDRPSDYAPGAVFDEEAGHGGAEACRRAEALALSMSPRLNSQNPGLFCQLLF